ncbi:RyR domain-containing protein [Methanorbis furvi]|uniref:Ryanodine receptor Ryr domain-containing protein n=1 Tax=Methanorbis furvi TaxID=3028299 RepID=A0AAE4MCB7_9EURY|nr:hypothetical protein [Methanocorpusculaceae archaeon Ag1]
MDRKITIRSNEASDIELPIDFDFCYSHEYLSQRAVTKGIRNLIAKNPRFEDHTTTPPVFYVIGAGHIGKEIIADLARLCHLKNSVQHDNVTERYTYHTPAVIHVIDKDQEAEEHLYQAYPILRKIKPINVSISMLSAEDEIASIKKSGTPIETDPLTLPLPDITFHTCDIALPYNLNKLAAKILEDKADAVIIATGDDAKTVSTALSIEHEFDTLAGPDQNATRPIISIYYEKFGGFDAFFGNSRDNKLSLAYTKIIRHPSGKTTPGPSGCPTHIQPLANWSAFTYHKDSTHDKVDIIAQGADACYSRHDYTKDIFSSGGPNIEPLDNEESLDEKAREELKMSRKKRWDELPEIQQKQNRDQVYHNYIKLNLLGYSVIAEKKLKEGKNIPDGYEKVEWTEIQSELQSNVEWLSRLEHQRWWAEQLLAGWHYNPVRNDPLKHHPNMLPFEDLHDKGDEDKDRFAVCEMQVSFSYADYIPIKRI